MALFEVGKTYPSECSIERLAKYRRGRKIFDNKIWEVYDRAIDMLDKKNSAHAKYLEQLYISIGIMEILCTKPADLLVGDPPSFESGHPDDSAEQRALNRIVENNELVKQIHEFTIGNGYRGDAFLKLRHNVREDFSQVPKDIRAQVMAGVKPEPIIEAIDPRFVFPEFAQGSRKQVNAINIAWPEFVETDDDEVVYLNVERHVPGAIIYRKFRLNDLTVDDRYNAPIPIFTIEEEVDTGRDDNVELTGVPDILIEHVPYKTTDDRYFGISGVENLESVLAAINERIIQIDYILWRHSDPNAYGPPIEPDSDGGSAQSWGGSYITVNKDDVAPNYMTWNGNLDAAFRELEFLIGTVYQHSETPQWLFGTTLTSYGSQGGTGTSHTDSGAIKARFMPILSKVKRIRLYVDRAIRDILYKAQVLENYANQGVEDFEAYEPVYPTITWLDGLPKNEKELAEIMDIRTGGKPTISVVDAIKRMDDVDDSQAADMVREIDADEARIEGFTDASIFRGDIAIEDDIEDDVGDTT